MLFKYTVNSVPPAVRSGALRWGAIAEIDTVTSWIDLSTPNFLHVKGGAIWVLGTFEVSAPFWSWLVVDRIMLAN